MSALTRPVARAARINSTSESRGRGSGKIVPLVCGVLAIAGGIGLLAETGARTADVAVAEALTSLHMSWTNPTPAHRASYAENVPTPVVLETASTARSPSVRGDEGFWLSSQALAGNSGQALAVGDPMTVGGRHYLVTELAPLSGQFGLSPETKSAHKLTLVVATEVGIEGSQTEPRRLRFLIDGIAPSSNSPASDEPTRRVQGTL